MLGLAHGDGGALVRGEVEHALERQDAEGLARGRAITAVGANSVVHGQGLGWPRAGAGGPCAANRLVTRRFPLLDSGA